MNLMHIAWLVVTLIAMQGTPESSGARDKLAAFLGNWESKGTFKDTLLSKASAVTSKQSCAWSPFEKYLICDQTLSLGTDQLTVFSWNEKENSYQYCTIQNPGSPAHCDAFVIDGNVWTFFNSFENKGKKISIRTLNTFDAPGHEVFKTEFSEDGKSWTTMLEGEARRVKTSGP